MSIAKLLEMRRLDIDAKNNLDAAHEACAFQEPGLRMWLACNSVLAPVLNIETTGDCISLTGLDKMQQLRDYLIHQLADLEVMP